MENEFENKEEKEINQPEQGSSDGAGAETGNVPSGSDYNRESQMHEQPYHQENQMNEQPYHQESRMNEQPYHQESGSYQSQSQNQNQNPYSSGTPPYKAPDYGYNAYQDQQGFHNEYQENHNMQYGDGRRGEPGKSGGTAKKVAVIAGCAVVLGIVAAVAFRGADALIGNMQRDAADQGQQQQQDDNQGLTLPDDEVSSEEQEESGSTPSQSQTIEKTPVGNYDSSTIVSEIAEEVVKSLVSIDCTVTNTYSDYFGRDYSQDATGSGSGFIIGESDTELFLATNNHVVEGASEIKVTFIDQTEAEATTKGTDSSADLAVISVKKDSLKKDTLDAVKIASLGNSDDVKLGEMVIAIGNALGYGQSLTVGYISAKDREVEVDDNEKMILLQTDAAINPGNSGGVLLNLNGQVIGIPSIKYADSTVEGMGFAIPISRATPILDELMKREVLTEEEQGYLGVSCLDVTSDATVYGIPVGVYVSEVSDDGAAKEAGIQVGDIITALNGMEITSKEALVEKVHSYRIGTEITLTIQRSHNGKYKEMEIKAKLKGASTIEGLPDDSEKSTDTPEQPGNNGGNSDGGNSGDTFGGDGGSYGSGENGMEDFYDFFNDFFN